MIRQVATGEMAPSITMYSGNSFTREIHYVYSLLSFKAPSKDCPVYFLEQLHLLVFPYHVFNCFLKRGIFGYSYYRLRLIISGFLIGRVDSMQVPWTYSEPNSAEASMGDWSPSEARRGRVSPHAALE